MNLTEEEYDKRLDEAYTAWKAKGQDGLREVLLKEQDVKEHEEVDKKD